MRHYFDFDGVKSSDYGVLISEAETFGAPARDIEEIVVPGRNGNLTLDNGRFAAIRHTYPAYIPETAQANLTGLRNALMTKRGHQRLCDSLHADEFYKAYYEKGLEPELTANLKHSELEIEFTRDPRRFLVAGDVPVDVPAASTETFTDDVVTYYDPSGIAKMTITAASTATTVTVIGQNLFDEDSADWKTGYLIDSAGNESANASYKYSQEYTRVLPSTQYAVQIDKGTSTQLAVTIAYYDDQQAFISRESAISATTATGRLTGTFTTPATAAWIRMNAPKNYTREVMVEYGEATEYQAYAGEDVAYSAAFDVTAHKGWNTVYADDGQVTVVVAKPFGIANPTLFDSSPLFRVYGTGTLYAGGSGITVTGSYPYIDIDTEIADCYYGATNANSKVTISGDFPKLGPGMNYFRYTGFRAVEVTPRWWRL